MIISYLISILEQYIISSTEQVPPLQQAVDQPAHRDAGLYAHHGRGPVREHHAAQRALPGGCLTWFHHLKEDRL